MDNSRENSNTRASHKTYTHLRDLHSSNLTHQTSAILLEISNVVSNMYQGAKWHRIQHEARDKDTPMKGTVG